MMEEIRIDLLVAQSRLMRVEKHAPDSPMSFDSEIDIVRARKLVTSVLERLFP